MISYQNREIPETLDEILKPSHSALIIHELLHDFVSPDGVFDKTGMRIDISKTLPPSVSLLKAARRNDVKVIYVRFTTLADLSNLNDPMLVKTYERNNGLDHVVQPVVEGSWGWENIPEVAPLPNESIVKKLRVDCFLQTNLDLILRSNGIKSFVILGVGAERGIVPTVAHGMNLGYFGVVPEDCINATSPSFYHTAKRFIGRYATLAASEKIINIWDA